FKRSANAANLIQGKSLSAHAFIRSAAGADPIGDILRAWWREYSFCISFKSESFSVHVVSFDRQKVSKY
ncbi:MAG: hypothetical protein D3925_20935, partial [Candidatus Electrothrix sp. AR5]|nr:hypothetical protein [Candidatus Electrothrix sp. AR5]